MKPTLLFDLLFIVLFAALAFTLSELNYSEILSRYSVILMATAYFIGKWVQGPEFGKKTESPQPTKG